MTISALSLFLDSANDLKQLPRMGWLLAGVAQPESVADHTCAVALLVLALVDAINADPSAHGLERPLDQARAIRLALLHDLAESIVTDLPKRSSDVIGKQVKHAAESAALEEIVQGLPNGADYVALWSEYDAATSAEARLVRDADKLEMVHQALRYQQRGHTNLAEFLRGHSWSYAICAKMADFLSQRAS